MRRALPFIICGLVALVVMTILLYAGIVVAAEGDESLSQSTSNWTQTGVAGAVGVAALGLIRKLSALADDCKTFIKRSIDHFVAEEAVLHRVDKTLDDAAKDKLRAEIRDEVRRENSSPIAVGDHR